MKHGVQKGFFCLLLIAASLVFLYGVFPGTAQAAINPQISFQGKITNPDGTNITSNSYSIRFRLYSDPTADATNTCSANTCKWEETKSVTVTDGIFQTALGDTTALPGSVDFNSSAIYLGIKVATDSEMTPRVRFTASPYAFNSDKVGGLTASQLVQLSPGAQQTGSIDISGTGNFATALTTAGNITSSAGVLSIQGAGTSTFAGALQSSKFLLGSDLSLIPIANGQSALSSYWGLQLVGNKQGVVNYTPTNIGTAGAYGVLIPVQNAGAVGLLLRGANAQTGDLLQIQNNVGTVLASVDAAGNLVVVGNTTVSTNLYATTIDAATATTLNLASTNATAVSLGKYGVVTSIPGGFTVNSGTNVPTADQVSISNAGSAGVTTAGVNGLNVNYKGGAAAVEAAGMRIDYAPGTTSGGTWSGLRIVADATGPVTGVNAYGIKLEGPSSPGAGTEIAIRVASGWDIGLDLQSGGLQMADISADPTAPAAGNLKVYSRLVAGRSMLSQVGSSGVSYAFQPSLFQQNVMLVTPGGTTTAALNATGGQVTSTGTLNTSLTATEAAGGMASYTTAATAGTPAGFAGANNQYFRGSVANGADGFFYFARVNLSDATLANYTSTTTGARLFFGLTDQTMATMGASNNPTGNYIGFQFAPSRDAGVMQLTSRDGTTQSQTASGLTLASSKTYDFYIYSKPRDTTIYFRIDNLTDGTTSLTGSKTTNLPTATIAMKPMIILAPISAAARTMQFQRMYVESDR